MDEGDPVAEGMACRVDLAHRVTGEGTVLMDETGEYAAQLGIRGVPCNVIVDARGRVRAVGATTPDELNDTVASLLAEG
ncbi:MAG TPA: hypothetical protein VG253_16140 [Streptosporangiaceae bacterium]|nr:hypothetical protein [Streptosporangiaceae bacterium]